VVLGTVVVGVPVVAVEADVSEDCDALPEEESVPDAVDVVDVPDAIEVVDAVVELTVVSADVVVPGISLETIKPRAAAAPAARSATVLDRRLTLVAAASRRCGSNRSREFGVLMAGMSPCEPRDPRTAG
jgi:hypothetical protein